MGLATLVDFLPRLLLFSTVYKRDDGEATGTYVDLLVVTSPSSRPANASGSLLLLVQRAALLVQVTHGLVITLTRTTFTCPSLRMYIPPCPG